MTLILTAACPLGVVMVADSAITYYDEDGNVSHVNEVGWNKLLPVRYAKGGISYWGHIGAIRPRFDQWLEYIVRENAAVTDLQTFANMLAERMNEAVSHRIIARPTGVHVAGMRRSNNGSVHPVIYHIHNGHGHFEVNGSTGHWWWQRTEDPKQFTVHQDFPRSTGEPCWMVRNGEFLLFSNVSDYLFEAVKNINRLEGIQIPSRTNDLGAYKGFIHTMVKIMVDLYRVSNLHRSVGGRVVSLAVSADGVFLE